MAFGAVARGVQFHPEMDARVLRGYIEARQSCLVEERLDVEAILAAATEAPSGREILRNFVRRFVLSPARRAA
ncbi:MAG TPA: hypothetical protein VF881_12550 [Polyangiaceae bacterium]